MYYFDYYLKFTGSEHARSVLYKEDGSQVYDATYDTLGSWVEIDNANPENPVITPVEGFFVNVRSETEITWPDGVTVENPKTPWRVFA